MKAQRLMVLDATHRSFILQVFAIFERHCRESWSELCRRLHAAGIPGPNGKLWNRKRLLSVLENQVYTGYWLIEGDGLLVDVEDVDPEDFDQGFKAKVMEPLITEARFNGVKRLLQQRTRKATAGRNAKGKPFVLRALLQCEQGRGFWGSGKKNRRYRHTESGAGKRGQPCSCEIGGSYLDADALESAVIATVKDVFGREAFLEELQAQVERELRAILKEGLLERVRKRIHSLRQRSQAVEDMYVVARERGTEDGDRIFGRFLHLQAALSEAESTEAVLRRRADLRGGVIQTAKDLVASLPERIAGLESEDREAMGRLLIAIIDRVVVLPDGTLRVEFAFSEPF